MRTRDLRRLLRRKGCELVGTEGSHEKWVAPGGHTTTLKASAKDQAPGTLRSIQAQLVPDLGERWLEKAVEQR
jgi:predicted RNA binding protein YcfA (HicA-like mRNA interferase family)